MNDKTPIALTIAGSDSGGGAGVQADLKAMSATGVYGASVVTVVTAQNTTSVTAVHAIPADIVAAQIKAVLSDLDVQAIKIGMLFSPDIIEVVAQELAQFKGPIVVDPVMIAKSGDALLQDAAVAAMITQILPLATVLTPNLPEAARLLGTHDAETTGDMTAQGKRLLDMGPKAILMKGGHSKSDICTDLLVTTNDAQIVLTAPRVNTQNTHGTGCTFSAAIAAKLAQGYSLQAAVEAAHTYLQGAIAAADTLQIGHGHGPVHHFHGQW